MYALFYVSHLIFGGIGGIMTGVAGLNAFRKREEQHVENMKEAKAAGYWTGYGQAWPVAHRRGEESMLQVCQALATESIDMAGVDPMMQHEFNQYVATWPQFALEPQPITPYWPYSQAYS